MGTLKIVTIGDSNTQAGAPICPDAQNHGQVLANLLNTQFLGATGFTFINRGASWSATWNWVPNASAWGPGAPSYNGVYLLQAALALKGDLYPAWLGTNGAGVQTKENYKSDLRQIVEAILANPINNPANHLNHSMPILIQPPVAAPCNDANPNGYALPAGVYPYGRKESGLIDMKTVVLEVGAEYNIPTVSLFDYQYAIWHSQTNTTTASFLYDGVHDNAIGHGQLATLEKTALTPFLGSNGELTAPPVIIPVNPSNDSIQFYSGGAWHNCSVAVRENGGWYCQAETQSLCTQCMLLVR